MNHPKVGVAAIITRNGCVLLIRRKGVHGEGSWSTPGGHLEFGESPDECAARETREEVGVEISNVRFIAVTNDVFENAKKHYITIWMQGVYSSGEARIAAAYEVAEIGWFAWNSLPEPLFKPLENLINRRSFPPDAIQAFFG